MKNTDEKEYLLSLIQRIRNKISYNASKKIICDELAEEGYNVGEIYLAYSAAKLLEKYFEK